LHIIIFLEQKMPTSHIWPQLYVGDAVLADEELDVFDCVVNITQELQRSSSRKRNADFQPLPALLLNSNEYEQWHMYKLFPRAIEMIEDILTYEEIEDDFTYGEMEDDLNYGKKVLVHCIEDTQKSYTVVAAYLIWKNACKVDEAISYIVQQNAHAFESSKLVTFRQACWAQTRKHQCKVPNKHCLHCAVKYNVLLSPESTLKTEA
jgi:hypothetical protein